MNNHQLQDQLPMQVNASEREESYDIFEENGDIQLDKREEVEENVKKEKVEQESSSDDNDENLSDILPEDYDSNNMCQFNNYHLQNMSGFHSDNHSIDFSIHNKYPLRRLVSSNDKREINSQNSLNYNEREHDDISLGEQVGGSENYQYNRNRSLMNLIQSADGEILSQNNLSNSDQPRVIQIIGEKYEKGNKFYKVLWSDRKISIEDVSVVSDYKHLKDEYELQVQQFLDMSHINRIDSREKISIFARKKRKVCIEQKKKKISDLNKQKYRIKKLITEGNLTPEDFQKIHEERRMRRKKIERRKNKELLDIKAEQSDAVIDGDTQKSYITRRRMSSLSENQQEKRQSISQQKPKENKIQQSDDQQKKDNTQKASQLEQEQNQNAQIEEEKDEIEDEQNEFNQSQSQEEYKPKNRKRCKRNSKNQNRKQNKKILNIKEQEKDNEQQTQIQRQNIDHKSDYDLNQTNHKEKSQIQDQELKQDEQLILDIKIYKIQNCLPIPQKNTNQIDQSNKQKNIQIKQKTNQTKEVKQIDVYDNLKYQQPLQKNGQPIKIQWKKLAKMMKEQNINGQTINEQPNQIDQMVRGSKNNQQNEEQIDKDKLNLLTEHNSQDQNSQEVQVKTELNDYQTDAKRQDQLIDIPNYSQSLKKNGQPRKIQWKKLAKMKREIYGTSENNIHNQNAQSGEPSQVGKTRRKTLKSSQEIKTNKQILNKVDKVPQLRQKYQQLRVRKVNLRISKNSKRKQKVYNLRSQTKK
ncbi:hypothetical protein ABPG72_017519 [Tetrahymena utriculariae]